MHEAAAAIFHHLTHNVTHSTTLSKLQARVNYAAKVIHGAGRAGPLLITNLLGVISFLIG